MKQDALDGRHTRKDEQGHHGNPALDGLRAISICLVLAGLVTADGQTGTLSSPPYQVRVLSRSS